MIALHARGYTRGYTWAQRTELWRRYRAGEPLREIAPRLRTRWAAWRRYSAHLNT